MSNDVPPSRGGYETDPNVPAVSAEAPSDSVQPQEGQVSARAVAATPFDSDEDSDDDSDSDSEEQGAKSTCVCSMQTDRSN